MNTREKSTLNNGANTRNNVRTRNASRNDVRFDLRERLKVKLAETTQGVPAKELEQITGIPYRTIENHRTGLQLCSLEDALRYIAALPNSPFAHEAYAAMSGEGEACSPENIDRLVRFFNTRK